jgi:hypothetical protein
MEPRCRRYAEQITHAGGRSLSQSGALTSRKPLTFEESERRLRPGAGKARLLVAQCYGSNLSALLVDERPRERSWAR